jgi:hypothetical protein
MRAAHPTLVAGQLARTLNLFMITAASLGLAALACVDASAGR